VKRYLIPLALPLALAACTQQQQDNAAQCGLALYAANVRTAGELFTAAQQVPACRALAADVLQAILAQVMQQRGVK
jgi:hypothetical protein